jgi:hypothetical protein
MVKHMKECQKVQKAKAKKKNMCVSDRPTNPKILICVFPIAWSSKLGSVGQDFFIYF